MFGCPRLNYAQEQGWYGEVQLIGGGSLRALAFNDPPGIARPWLIPANVWQQKQGHAENSTSALITLKYFVVDTRGIAITLATQTMNLDRLRAGDNGIHILTKNASRITYKKATGASSAPF